MFTRGSGRSRMTTNLSAFASHGVPHCTSNTDIGFVTLGPAKVALLGVVQGITELLPVSSSAHMRAIPAFLGWQDPGAAFSAAMQLAALLAIVVYFRADIVDVIGGSIVALKQQRRHDSKLRAALAVLIATVPIAIVGALFSKILNACGSIVRDPMLVGAACVLMALLMGAAERFARHERPSDIVSLSDALWIGIAQVGALIPGVSRSGSTFAAALSLGFKRQDAARVSFLLGVPAISLAGLNELWVLRDILTPDGWLTLSIGLAVSSISAFGAIWGLMRFLEHSSTWLLVIYRTLFGLTLMIGSYVHWIH